MKKVNEVEDYVLTNREKAQMSNKAKFWCGGCDLGLAGEIGKCSVCGTSNSTGNEIKQ